MNLEVSGTKKGVCLAFVGDFPESPEILKALSDFGWTATFFVPPDRMVHRPDLWRRALAEGHELGNSALVGVTDHGRLRNWACEAIEDDVRSVDRLLKELGVEEVEALFLPGVHHVCAEGRYRAKAMRRYRDCVSPAPRACSLHWPLDLNRIPLSRLADDVAAAESPVVIVEQIDERIHLLINLLGRDDGYAVTSLAAVRAS